MTREQKFQDFSDWRVSTACRSLLLTIKGDGAYRIAAPQSQLERPNLTPTRACRVSNLKLTRVSVDNI